MDPRQKKKIWVQRKTPNLEKKQNKQTLDYNAGQKKKKKKMMRFLGSTLAKVMEGSCLLFVCFCSMLLVALLITEIGKEQNVAVLWQGEAAVS